MEEGVTLREFESGDLETFFEQEKDPAARQMAAFASTDPEDKATFLDHWDQILHDPEVRLRTILYHGRVAGYITKFRMFGQPSVAYWLGRSYWGRGIATRALQSFLHEETLRPLYARVAADNLASARVLAKCGFEEVARDHGFANARGMEIEEIVLRKTES
jgi:RimJ/RimL family protein N-acetyltransferase